jgi:FtsZ-binding cell division protein ZapB
MENQMADLRKQCSSLEQEITSAKEDNKSFQQHLRDKVGSTCTGEVSS